MPTLLRLLTALVIPLAIPVAVHAADTKASQDMQTCKARQGPLLEKAERFKGDSRMRRLIEADLRRASREEMEGDADECLEALDHAAKLLAGDA